MFSDRVWDRVRVLAVAPLLHEMMVRAMAMLAQSGVAVLDVATAVGFDSPSAFSRVFRTFTGLTPADYRRRAGQLATTNASRTHHNR